MFVLLIIGGNKELVPYRYVCNNWCLKSKADVEDSSIFKQKGGDVKKEVCGVDRRLSVWECAVIGNQVLAGM